MANLTRRLFLRRAAALAPLTMVPTLAVATEATSPSQAMALTPTAPDAEVRRLAKAFRAAKKAQAHTALVLAEIEHRIEAAEPDYPPEPRMTKEEWAEHDNATLKMIREQAYGPLMTDFWARCEAWRRTKEAIKNDTVRRKEACRELRAARRAHEKANIAVSRAGDKLYRTRASTIDGVLMKLRIEWELEFDEYEIQRQVAKDLRSLKKAGAVVAMKVGA